MHIVRASTGKGAESFEAGVFCLADDFTFLIVLGKTFMTQQQQPRLSTQA